MEIYRQAEFPDNSHFLIVDQLIHGCKSRECKRKLMAKGKDVTIKDCLEIMRKFEAVEVTMKKLEDVGDAHVDASYASDPTKKSQKKWVQEKTGETKVNIKTAKSLMRRRLVYGAKEMFIPVKSALQKMPHATFVVNKDTLNEHVLKKKGTRQRIQTPTCCRSLRLNKTVVTMMMTVTIT